MKLSYWVDNLEFGSKMYKLLVIIGILLIGLTLFLNNIAFKNNQQLSETTTENARLENLM